MAQPSQPKKQFKIEAFKHNIKRDPNWQNEAWKTLENAIHQINNHNESKLSFEELYRTAYNMVIMKIGDKLYDGLRDTQRGHLRNVARLIQQARGEEGLLREVKLRWDNYNKSMNTIRDVLMVGLDLWRDTVVREDPGNPSQHDVPRRLVNAMLNMIKAERNGEKIDRPLMRSMTQMLSDLGTSVYEHDFQEPFLEQTTLFYQAEAQTNISSCDCPTYLERAEQRLNEETERVDHYLHDSTEHRLISAVEYELLEKQLSALLEMENSGLVPLLEADRCTDLARLYTLARRIETGLEAVKKGMQDHIKAVGLALVRDPERTKDPITFVQRLLEEKAKYDHIIQASFANDRSFQNALNQAFEYFLNEYQRSPEYISLFMDDLLRKGIKSMKEEDVDATSDKVMMLFRYLKDKDLFEKYYKQHLAKRLLSGRMVSEDAERTLLVKLKTECGYQFTSKLESMFNDIKISQETMLQFKQYLRDKHIELDTDIVVQVLTTGSWPAQSAQQCQLPHEVAQVCEHFKAHYLTAHNNRKLTWQTNMGNADIKVTFADGRKHELNVSTFQMCILLLFNDTAQLSYREIADGTQIPAADLKRALQSLACVKGKVILKKEPAGKDVNEGDVFTFNESFTSKLYKVKVGTVAAQKENEAEKQETRQRVEEDRKPQIEAAIVRIMKARRVLDHNSIVAEVTRQLSARFIPNPQAIKKHIESLIEREFLARDANDRKMYKYLA